MRSIGKEFASSTQIKCGLRVPPAILISWSAAPSAAMTKVTASVRPEQVPLTDPLAAVTGTSSVITFESDIFPQLTITENNPGLKATAYGMFADFIRAVES